MRRSHDRRRITGRRTRVTAARANGVAVLEETLIEEMVAAEIPVPREHGEYLPTTSSAYPAAWPRARLARPPP